MRITHRKKSLKRFRQNKTKKTHRLILLKKVIKGSKSKSKSKNKQVRKSQKKNYTRKNKKLYKKKQKQRGGVKDGLIWDDRFGGYYDASNCTLHVTQLNDKKNLKELKKIYLNDNYFEFNKDDIDEKGEPKVDAIPIGYSDLFYNEGKEILSESDCGKKMLNEAVVYNETNTNLDANIEEPIVNVEDSQDRDLDLDIIKPLLPQAPAKILTLTPEEEIIIKWKDYYKNCNENLADINRNWRNYKELDTCKTIVKDSITTNEKKLKFKIKYKNYTKFIDYVIELKEKNLPFLKMVNDTYKNLKKEDKFKRELEYHHNEQLYNFRTNENIDDYLYVKNHGIFEWNKRNTDYYIRKLEKYYRSFNGKTSEITHQLLIQNNVTFKYDDEDTTYVPVQYIKNYNTTPNKLYDELVSYFSKLKYYKGLVEAYIPIFYLLLEPTKYTGLNKLIILNNFVIKCESEKYIKNDNQREYYRTEPGTEFSFGNELIQNFINNFPSFNWRDTEENYNLFTYNNVTDYSESDKYFNTGLDTGLELVFNLLVSIDNKLTILHGKLITFIAKNNIKYKEEKEEDKNEINDLFQIKVYMQDYSFLILNKDIVEQAKVFKYIKLIYKINL